MSKMTRCVYCYMYPPRRGQHSWRSSLAVKKIEPGAFLEPARSIGVFVCPSAQRCQHHNLGVEPQRPVLDIKDVVFDAAAHLIEGIRLAAEAVDLRPAGDTRLHFVPPMIAADQLRVLLVVFDRVRSRTDHRHVAPEDVEQLREFVEARNAKDSADARDARVVLPSLRHAILPR